MSLLDGLHGGYVSRRRGQVLSSRLAPLLPQAGRVVDVGCGDGGLTRLLSQLRPDVSIAGLDVLQRDRTFVPVQLFDGRTLPLGSGSVDAVLLVDAVHHAEDPMGLLYEAARVACRSVVIKDHVCDGLFAEATLRFMDRIGNARFGVALPHTYWRRAAWLDAFASLGLVVETWEDRLGLYPWPANWIFERSLHFIARLDVPAKNRGMGE